MTVNLQNTMKEFYSVFRSVLHDLGLKENILTLDGHIYEKRKPLEHSCNLIESSGFRIIDLYEDTFSMRYANGTSFLNHFAIRLGFRGSWEAVIEAGERGRVFSELESRLNDIARVHNELHLTVPWVCIQAVKT
jgi:hypothetical protein